MSNKIKLQFPYTTKWSTGYMVINKENRKHVLLIASDGKRSSTSYARYLMSVHEGRFLEKDEQVDHIDNDKTNDVIENLQILSVTDNIRKEAAHKGKLTAEIKCPECGKVFTKCKGITQAVKSFEGKVTCCSAACARRFSKRRLTRQERDKISKDSLLRVFRMHT